jgi:hypothetical protein
VSAGPQVDWFSQNAPPQAASQGSGDWFNDNAPRQAAQPPEQPGFFKRLGQSLGVPTSMEQLQASAQPSTAETIIGPAATAGKMLWNYGKTAIRGSQEGGQDVTDAAQNIRAGQPILPNVGKAGFGLLHGLLQATPFVGPAIDTAGQDVANQNYAGAAGGLTGVIGQVAAPELIARGVNAANRLAAPLGDTVTKPRGTIAPEQYSPQELKAYADANNIPLNAAQATEHNLPRNIQSAGERATIGGTAVRQQNKAAQAAVATHTNEMMDGFSPDTPDRASAGAAIQNNVEAALNREQETSRQQYADIDKQAQGVTVDLTPVKETAARVLSDSNFVRQAGLDPKSATRILQGIENTPDAGTFSQAQQLRSALLDASRSPDLAISTQAQGWIKQLTGATDRQMMEAAQSKPGLEDSFRTANDHWQQLQDDFNSPRSALRQILQEPDPSKVPQKLTQRGQTGGSPYNAQLLDQYGIDKGPIKRVIMEDLLSKDFRLWNKTLGGYSDDFMRSMFTPEELDSVYKTAAIGRSVGLNTNPSGTAGVTGAMEDVQKPIRSLLPKAAAAKMTNSQRFNDRMMQAPGKPASRTVPLSVLLGSRGLDTEDE